MSATHPAACDHLDRLIDRHLRLRDLARAHGMPDGGDLLDWLRRELRELEARREVARDRAVGTHSARARSTRGRSS